MTQPAPKAGEVAVWASLLHETPGLSPELRAMCAARDELGRGRYGTPLETRNGRDPHQDAIEEMLDGAAYLWQAWLEGDPEARADAQEALRMAERLRVRVCLQRGRR